ncbi:MAG TPA: SDR family oxidoreductase [Azospirillaceae bacterium]|nr:SDR family oxidoreductase [Azospirillaceae bacterium]HRQ79837.1 SDR family oxidoreductase [Azospirillaceae bacterium]
MIPDYAFNGRRVLVTGASAGIGRACAIALAGLGARVVVNGRNEGRLAETLAALPGDGHGAAPFDLTDCDQIPGWIKVLATDGGPLAGVAHCAGTQSSKPVRSVDTAYFDQVMRANLLSALALARGLRQKGCCAASGGAMVLVSSVAAFIGQPGNVVYSASKGALVSAARGLAMELLRDNIRVNCVAPAMVETEMMERFRQTTTAEQFARIREAHPMGFGKPEDVAAAVAFLLSDAARWINGVCLPVDGGYLAQ